MSIGIAVVLLVFALLIAAKKTPSPAPREDDSLSWIDELEIVDAIDEDD
jgi:hypothetical protein